ncbi:hypothetical protein BJF78_27780 [Pseudonocardia sp. CNS-139]|nr:hypothetical protein BJF78_27780 [Pseudonocardia sp. CNS-139]
MSIGGVSRRSVGAILRAERLRRRLTLAQAGKLLGYSPSALSRIELGDRRLDVESLLRLAECYGIPPSRLGVANLSARDGVDGSGDDVQRRQFLAAAAGATIPGWLLTRLDDALVTLPDAAGPVTVQTVEARKAASQALFDAASYTALVAGLPDLLAAAQELADGTDEPAAQSCAAGCYEIATHALNKIGRHRASRLTADRAMTHARRSDSPLAVASSSRALSVVLRHEGRAPVAQRVNLAAIRALEATGLLTTAERTVLARTLCSAAYAAAQSGDRDRALELIADAHRSVRGLPGHTAAQVQLYQVGVHWAVGDSARALDSGRGLHPAQFATPERRGRLHTDLARAWWQHERPERTALSLVAAHREAPTELTDRPAIRRIAFDLIDRHPRVTGVRELRVALRSAGPAG